MTAYKTALFAIAFGTAVALSDDASARIGPAAAFDACVKAVADASGAKRLDVVRRVQRLGSGNEELWFNALDVAPTKSYCRTHRGEVAQLMTFEGAWRRTTASRPATTTTVARNEPR